MIKIKNRANFVASMLVMLGIMGILDSSVWAAPTTQINKLNRVPTQVTEGESTAKPRTSSPNEQPFVPFLQNVVNDQAARNGILANTYVVRTCRSYTTPEGADVNAINDNGATAIMLASRVGNSEVAKLLIEKGANVNLVSKSGKTALTVARNEGYADIEQLLLKAGAK